MKNNIEVDYGRNSVVPQPHFSLLSSSSSSLRFLSVSLNARPWNLFTQPPSRLFIAKYGIRGHGNSPRRAGARPGELLLQPEVTLLAQAS